MKTRGDASASHTAGASEKSSPPFLEALPPSAKIANMPNISLHTKRLAAALGQINEDTVERVIAGRPTRPATRERALEGLRAAGVAELTLDAIIAAKGDGRKLGEVADSNARVASRSSRSETP